MRQEFSGGESHAARGSEFLRHAAVRRRAVGDLGKFGNGLFKFATSPCRLSIWLLLALTRTAFELSRIA